VRVGAGDRATRAVLDHLLRVDQRHGKGAAVVLEEVGDHPILCHRQGAVAAALGDELSVRPAPWLAVLGAEEHRLVDPALAGGWGGEDHVASFRVLHDGAFAAGVRHLHV
jgi:hypothetical protein